MKERLIILVIACVAITTTSFAQEDAFEKVKKILATTNNVVVIDGTEAAPLKDTRGGTPSPGDWLVEHQLSDPDILNPFTTRDASAGAVIDKITQSLLDPVSDPPYELKGMIAKAYPTISEDRLSYTFDLRENVTFSDGTPLTVDDVIFSLKAIMNPEVLSPNMKSYFEDLSSVKPEGKHRVTFTLKKPYFKNDITVGLYLDIIPKHFYDPDDLMGPVSVESLLDGTSMEGPHVDRIKQFAEHFNTGFNRKIMGSGPYMIVNPETDIVTQQKVVLTRNPDYWGANEDLTRGPGYVEKYVYKTINNQDAAFIELTNGNLDFHGLKPLEFKENSWTPEFTEKYLKGIRYLSGYIFIGWNNNHKIFGDTRVRKAMSHIINRREMIENLLFGLGEPVDGPIHPFRPEYNSNLTTHEYDPDKALDILEEAGWVDSDDDGILDKEINGERVKFEMEFLVNSGNQLRKDIGLVFQSEANDIGIACQVIELDWGVFLQRVTKDKNFDAMTLGWSGGGGVAFAPDAYTVWHSSQIEGGGYNFISFRNDEVDKILTAYREEFDSTKRIQLYQRFQEILNKEQPYTFLWNQRVATAYSRRFRDANWYPGGTESGRGSWWVEKANRLYP
jgi:peptide/nickel transport system substrate-binding protein